MRETNIVVDLLTREVLHGKDEFNLCISCPIFISEVVRVDVVGLVFNALI